MTRSDSFGVGRTNAHQEDLMQRLLDQGIGEMLSRALTLTSLSSPFPTMRKGKRRKTKPRDQGQNLEPLDKNICS